MGTELTRTNGTAEIVERVIIAGDLSKLSAGERVDFYRKTCESLNLNPLTKPFEYITLNGKLTLYATRNCTDQLRARQHVSVRIVSREKLDDIYVVAAQATLPDGRFDESIGAVNIKGLSGDNLANAFMKAETKAKRRATLSIVGLSFADETEIDTIPSAQRTTVNPETGEILDTPHAVSASSDRASDKQIGFIKGISRKQGWSEGDVLEWAAPVIGQVSSFADLTRQQASDLITALKDAESAETNSRPVVEPAL